MKQPLIRRAGVGDGGSGETIASLSLSLSLSVSLVHVKPLLSERQSYVSVRDVVRPLLPSFQENFTDSGKKKEEKKKKNTHHSRCL